MSAPRRPLAALLTVAAATALLLSGCFAPGATGADPAPASTPIVDVDDFEFASFEAEYTLGRAADGTSLLRTVETIVAVFPDYDQNRGIQRTLALTANGHPTELRVLGVTRGGSPLEYETEEQDGSLAITMVVPAGEYVHGEQEYVLTYEQRSVIGEADGGQEFFWDVNGIGWGQPFGVVTARIELAADVASAVSGTTGCWVGPAGSTETCDLSGAKDRYRAEVSELGPGETLTIRLTFAAGTFTD